MKDIQTKTAQKVGQIDAETTWFKNEQATEQNVPAIIELNSGEKAGQNDELIASLSRETCTMQWEAIETILAEVQRDPAVQAVFLKGALAYGQGDPYTDVDFYCLVREECLADFLARRIGILEKYQEIVYWSESNFVGPQIVAVFANGLHFDLYTVTESKFPLASKFLVLYDPLGILPAYQEEVHDLALKPAQMETYFHEFCFTLLELETALKRKQLLFVLGLISYLSGDLMVLIRQIYDPERAQIGRKKLELFIPANLRERLYQTLDVNTPEKALRSALQLTELMEETVTQLEKQYALQLNWRFFRFMQARLQDMQAEKNMEV